VEEVVRRLISQTMKPDKIVLYLSLEEFVDKELPFEPEKYKHDGFEVRWVEKNLKSHKKYFYVFEEYKDDIIITVDDDVFYPETAIEELMLLYEKYPNAVLARRVHRITFIQEGNIAPYEKWDIECGDFVGEPRMDLCAIGCGGILYPPHIFGQEVFNVGKFEEMCPYADDMWLKIMEVYYNIPVVLVKKLYEDNPDLSISAQGLSNSVNRFGNDAQLDNLLKYYKFTDDNKETIINRIKKNDYVLIENLAEEKYINMANEVAGMIADNKYIVYGAGTVARRIYNLFKYISKIDNIICFVVNDESSNPSDLYGIPVLNWRVFVDKKESIIIALTEAASVDVKNQLVSEGVENNRIIMIDRNIQKVMRDKQLR
jgi:hypothetical protein